MSPKGPPFNFLEYFAANWSLTKPKGNSFLQFRALDITPTFADPDMLTSDRFKVRLKKISSFHVLTLNAYSSSDIPDLSLSNTYILIDPNLSIAVLNRRSTFPLLR